LGVVVRELKSYLFIALNLLASVLNKFVHNLNLGQTIVRFFFVINFAVVIFLNINNNCLTSRSAFKLLLIAIIWDGVNETTQ